METPASNFFQTRFEAAPPLLRGQALRPMSVAEFTEVGELLLLEARRSGCPFWLLDGRADQLREQPALHHWVEDEYLPRVHVALGRPLVVAFLVSAAVWAQLQLQGIAVPTLVPTLSAAFRTAWFTEEAPAQIWLNQFRGAARGSQRPPGSVGGSPPDYAAGPSTTAVRLSR